WTLGCVYLGLLAHFSLSHEAYARPSSDAVPELDNYLHAIAYALPAAGFVQLWPSFPRVTLALAAYGVFLEYMQKWGGVRGFEYSDMLTNLASAAAGAWISLK